MEKMDKPQRLHGDDLVRMAREMFTYNPGTGELYRADPGEGVYCSPSRYKAVRRHFGRRADFMSGPYMSVTAFRVKYRAHIIAWAICYGYIPSGDIDHIDMDKTNNRISNLREATRSQNIINKGRIRSNTSGASNVSWHKKARKWEASITKDYKKTHLGLFDDFEEAKLVVRNHKIEAYGEFVPEVMDGND